MQLKLFSWPPLASHLACLIIGYSISQLSLDKTKTKDFKFSTDLIYFRADKKFEKILKKLKVNQEYYVKFNIDRSLGNNSATCLFFKYPIRILSPKAPFVLSAHIEDSATLAKWQNLRQVKSKIILDDQHNNEQNCEEKVEVSYGT